MSTKSHFECRKISVPQLAKQWGVSPNKILAWIRDGQLRALNMAAKKDGRPQYLIDDADIKAFEQSREVQPTVQKIMRPRRRRMNVEHFPL